MPATLVASLHKQRRPVSYMHSVPPTLLAVFIARDSIICYRAYAIARPSVCPSVRHTGRSVKNAWS